MQLSPAITFAFILALGLLIASYFQKRVVLRLLLGVPGTVIIVTVACMVSSMVGSIPGLYEAEHRAVENAYHRTIIEHLDRLLAEGNDTEAQEVVTMYLQTTDGVSFMRTPLRKIVDSIEESE